VYLNSYIFCALSVVLSSCSSISKVTEPLTPTHTIDEIRGLCDWTTTGEGCSELNQWKTRLAGTLYFPDSDSYQPRLFPPQVKIPIHDNDPLWESDLPETIDLRVTEMSKRQKKSLRAHHNKPVYVDAKMNAECVSAVIHAWNQPVDEDNIYFIAGYCHTQGSVYLTDFSISPRDIK